MIFMTFKLNIGFSEFDIFLNKFKIWSENFLPSFIVNLCFEFTHWVITALIRYCLLLNLVLLWHYIEGVYDCCLLSWLMLLLLGKRGLLLMWVIRVLLARLNLLLWRCNLGIIYWGLLGLRLFHSLRISLTKIK